MNAGSSTVPPLREYSAAAMYGILFVQQLLAASTHFVAKFANQVSDPFTIVFVRGVITVLAFAAILLPQRKTLASIRREDVKWIALLGLLNIPCNQVLFVAGLRFTIPPNAALAYALVPAFMLVLAALFFKEQTPRHKVVGIGVAFFGTLLILFERGIDLSSSFFWGNAMELSAAVSWSLYSLLGQRLSRRYGAIYTTGLSMASGMAWYGLAFPFLPFRQPLSELSGETVLYAAYLALAASVLGYWLWYFALARLPSSNVAVFSNLQPVLVTIISIVVFATFPSGQFLLGGALVLLGVLLTQRK
jgi:drug/metabolite transporter (DMT)-like permease